MKKFTINHFYFFYIFIVTIFFLFILFDFVTRETGSSFFNYLLLIICYLITIFLKIFFIKNKFKFEYILFFSSILICFILLDFSLYFYRILKNQDNISKNEIYIKSKGKIIPYLRPGHFNSYNIQNKNDILFLSSASNKKTILCKSEKDLKFKYYHSDRYGFNNPDYLWNKDINIILVGDSFVHGSCVDDKYTISGIIRNKYPHTLNLGFSGSDPLIEYAILKEYGVLISPKLIIWFYFEGNDQIELKKTFNTIYTKYLDHNFSSNLIHRQKEIDKFIINEIKKIFSQSISINEDIKFVKFLKQRITFYDVRFFLKNYSLSYKEYKKFENFNGYEIDPNFYSIVDKFKKKADELNSQILFVYLPDWSRYKFRKEENYYGRIEVINYIKKNNINFVDVVKIFDLEKNPLKLFDSDKFNAHYSEAGYKLVSKSLLDFLKRLEN